MSAYFYSGVFIVGCDSMEIVYGKKYVGERKLCRHKNDCCVYAWMSGAFTKRAFVDNFIITSTIRYVC